MKFSMTGSSTPSPHWTMAFSTGWHALRLVASMAQVVLAKKQHGYGATSAMVSMTPIHAR